MKTILISQRIVYQSNPEETRDALDVRWAPLAQNAGFILIPVPSFGQVSDYFDLVEPAGCILSGGNDLSSIEDTEINRNRDRLEAGLLKLCESQNLPILGVCRGCQFLWEYLGGKITPVQNHAGVSHQITALNSQSSIPLPKAAGSYHNYGLTHPPTTVEVLALAADQSIEAWKHKSKAIYGVLWHPEREPDISHGADLLREIFGGF